MAFTIDAKLLERLCAINAFTPDRKGLIFFGLRGCLPSDLDRCGTFKKKHKVGVETIDYQVPRCTLGQWKPDEGTIALFPGSTVPHVRHITTARDNAGIGANRLMTGFYKDYRKGKHRASSPTGHHAFRQTGVRPIRRSADDLDYDMDDRIEIENPADNLHAAWCMGLDSRYASAGCQVVVGYPACAKRGAGSVNTGAWADFIATAYGKYKDQKRFPYILLSGRDAQSVAESGTTKVPARLRFGSSGPLVGKVQKALAAAEEYEGDIDEDFGQRTLRALLGYQQRFGPDAGDGIVGRQTAAALGVSPWPKR